MQSHGKGKLECLELEVMQIGLNITEVTSEDSLWPKAFVISWDLVRLTSLLSLRSLQYCDLAICAVVY